MTPNLLTLRSGKFVRFLLVAFVTVAVLAVGGWYAVKKYRPQWLETETTNEAELAALQSAELTVAPAGTNWPQWFGPNRDGRAPAGPLRTDWDTSPPSVVWTVPCGGGYSSFAVVDGRLYTQDRQGDKERVLCLDAATGKELWVHETAVDYAKMDHAPGPRATPTVHDGRVYTLGATGLLQCVVPPIEPGQKPTVAWQKSLTEEYGVSRPKWGFACSPLIDGDQLIVLAGKPNASVVALDRATGQTKWKAGEDGNGYSSPVIVTAAGVRQVIAVTGESVLGIRPGDGNILWREAWKTEYQANVATPVMAGDYVFVSSGYAKGCSLFRLAPAGDSATAELVYFRKSRLMRNHHSTCVQKDGFLYGYDEDTLRCVDMRKGEEREDWVAREVSGNRGKGCVILAEDKYLLGMTQTGTLFLADANPEEFQLRGKVDGVLSGPDCWSLPVLVDGRVYVRDNTKVVCLDVRPK